MSAQDRLKRLTDIKAELLDLNMRIVKCDPWVEIVIHKQIFKLEFDFKTVLNIFRETGINLNLDILSPIALGEPELLSKLLFHGLQAHHPLAFTNIESMQAGMYIRFKNYYVACLLKALTAIQPDPEDIQAVLSQNEDTQVEQAVPLATTNTSYDSGEDVEILDVPNLK